MNRALENGEALACHCPEASSNRKGLEGSPLGQCCCCCKWERSVLKNETHSPEFRRNNNLFSHFCTLEVFPTFLMVLLFNCRWTLTSLFFKILMHISQKASHTSSPEFGGGGTKYCPLVIQIAATSVKNSGLLVEQMGGLVMFVWTLPLWNCLLWIRGQS